MIYEAKTLHSVFNDATRNQIMPQLRRAYSHVAVMGDLVDSQAAPSASKVHDVFSAVIHDANERNRSSLASPLTITLGDEFQGLCRTLDHAFTIVRSLRRSLSMQSVDCRFVVGVVDVETPVNSEKAWNMMGFGLAGTRRRLDDKNDPNAYRFFLPDDEVIEKLLSTIGYGMTITERRWTRRQREIVGLSQDLPNVTDVAAKLDITATGVYASRRAADFDFYRHQQRTTGDTLRVLDARYGFAE